MAHRRANALCCSPSCSKILNTKIPTSCECGKAGVKHTPAGWACQRCLDIEAMNDRANRARTAMREREAKASSQAACWAEAWA
jgi:hypothetical protein